MAAASHHMEILWCHVHDVCMWSHNAAIYWCHQVTVWFGTVHSRDFCLLSNIMGLNVDLLVVKNLTVMSLYRKHDPVTQDNTYTWLGDVHYR